MNEGCDSTQIIFPKSPICMMLGEASITMTGVNWKDEFGVTISLPKYLDYEVWL